MTRSSTISSTASRETFASPPRRARLVCDHCGLPVLGSAGRRDGKIYCCYGCRLVAQIVGTQAQGPHAWNVLRMSVGALLAMNVMMLSLLLYTGTAEGQSVNAFRWTLMGLSLPAMLILGYPFARGCLFELRRRRLSLDTLIAIGSFTAFGVSVRSTIAGDGLIYFDTATMLLALVTFGKLIEAAAKSRAGELLRSLQTLLPRLATRLEDGTAHAVELDSLRVGDLVQVLPGERFGVDGVVVEGSTTVEEAAFTGEAAPRTARAGDSVVAGSINGLGKVVVRADAVGRDMLVWKIIDMVEQAHLTRAPSQRLAEKIASFFVPAVLLLAMAAGAAWLAAGLPARAGLSALAVLVVACPCAMGIATPLATSIAIARAAREGIVVRGGDVMERIGQMRTLFLDKTGTLTTGRLSVARVATSGCGEGELVGALAALESGSEHAVARAILQEAHRRGIAPGSVADCQAAPGRGVRGRATWAGRCEEVLAGTAEFLQENRVAHLPGDGWAAADEASAQASAETVVHVAVAGRYCGSVHLSDTLEPDAPAAIERLRSMGIDVRLLSGDQPGSVRKFAEQASIGDYLSSCLPEAKVRHLQEASAGGRVVGLAGDGINDAPALAAASVGIAVGGGTDLAKQAGNVVLVGKGLSPIPWLVSLSRRARRVVMQNLLWALGYNLVAMAAAMLGLLHPLLAAVAMVISSLTLLSNSLRLGRFPSWDLE